MAVDGIPAQNWCVYPGDGERNFHIPPLKSVERSFEIMPPPVTVPGSACERSSSYGLTTTPCQ
jgi:hypothetical protein